MPWTTPSGATTATWSSQTDTSTVETWTASNATDATWSDGTEPYDPRDRFHALKPLLNTQPTGFAIGVDFTHRVRTPADWYVRTGHGGILIQSRITRFP